jgi:hypothetical protein
MVRGMFYVYPVIRFDIFEVRIKTIQMKNNENL